MSDLVIRPSVKLLKLNYGLAALAAIGIAGYGATEGAFRILGPPGYDVVSWLVSPVALGRPAAPAQHTRPPATLLPRCDDAILKARGDCVDRAAGPRQQSRGLEGELVIIREKNSSVVSVPEPPKGPIVYEFRLAHK